MSISSTFNFTKCITSNTLNYIIVGFFNLTIIYGEYTKKHKINNKYYSYRIRHLCHILYTVLYYLQASVDYLPELTNPIVACFSESESRVRYQAAEALFNVLKIVRGASLSQFPVIFDALAKLAADPEQQVKHAAELLDRLLKVLW